MTTRHRHPVQHGSNVGPCCRLGSDMVPLLSPDAAAASQRGPEGMAENDAFAVEARIGMEVFTSDDAKEDPRAFTQKRKPEFRGQ